MDPNKAFRLRKLKKKGATLARSERNERLTTTNNIFRCDTCGWKQVIPKDAFFNCRCTHCGYNGNGFTVMTFGED
jgi:hypothetical protein